MLVYGCAPKDNNVSMSVIKERMVSEVEFENPVVTDIKGNMEVAERYGVPLAKIEEGFVYVNDKSGKRGGSADEIIVLKVKDRKDISAAEKALESEITGLTEVWEGADKREGEKLRKHILKSKGSYVMLAVTAESKKAEEVFNELLK